MLTATEMKSVIELNTMLVKGAYMSAFSGGGSACVSVPESLKENQEFKKLLEMAGWAAEEGFITSGEGGGSSGPVVCAGDVKKAAMQLVATATSCSRMSQLAKEGKAIVPLVSPWDMGNAFCVARYMRNMGYAAEPDESSRWVNIILPD